MSSPITPSRRMTGMLLIPLVASSIFGASTLPHLIHQETKTATSAAAVPPPSYNAQAELLGKGDSFPKATNTTTLELKVDLVASTKGSGKKPSPTATVSPSPSPTTTASPSAPATTTTTVAPGTSSATDISAARLKFGVVNPSGPLASAELDALANTAGEKPSMLLFYKDFTQSAPISEINAAAARGAIPIVTWEPWVANGNVSQPAYSLDAIASGQYDAYLQSWGNAIKNNGTPVTLRFAHEMNGNWYPWSEGVNGNAAGDYVQAWRHVHDVVAATGATNITWMWAPNAPYWGSTDLTGLYPGTGYVDQVGLDGYNWGTTQSWGSAWQTPQQIFSSGISSLRTIAPGKDIIITEVGSAEQGGSKAQWNKDLVSYLAAQTDVKGFVWFNLNKEVDWRIESSTTSRDSFVSALDWREANETK